MARRGLAVGLLALVALSGCLTGQPTAPEPVANPGVDLAYDDRSVSDPPYDARDNPWRTDEIVVVVEDNAGMERNIAPDVMKTLYYWEENADDNAAYEPEYRLFGEHPNPDIRVELVQTVDGCGVHDDLVALGCAPVLTENSTVEGTTTVEVRSGHTPETMTEILKHEFGHTLGYEHSDESVPVMSANLSARAPEDVLDAADRKYPWASETLEVSVEAPDGLTETQRERLRSALRFYERGAEGAVSNPPSIELVPETESADVVVAFKEQVSECSVMGPEASCARWEGPNVDDDSQPEYYTGADVVVGSEGHDRPGWHVGYWLGKSLWTAQVPQPYYGPDKPPATTW